MARGKETAERDASSSGSHNWLIWGGAIATIIWFAGMILYAACVYPSYAVTDLTGAQRAADAGGQVHLWWRHHIGEHGDYLTGFLTPVAFGWFVITVFLQREELINQRTELRLSREQYEKTAEANEQISKSTDRQLVLRMLVDIERIGLSYVVQISEKFGSSMSIAGYPGRNINTRILPTEAASDNLAGAIRDLTDTEMGALAVSNSDEVREFLALCFRFATLFDDVEGLAKKVGLSNYMEDVSETLPFRNAYWTARQFVKKSLGPEALENGLPEILRR